MAHNANKNIKAKRKPPKLNKLGKKKYTVSAILALEF